VKVTERPENSQYLSLVSSLPVVSIRI